MMEVSKHGLRDAGPLLLGDGVLVDVNVVPVSVKGVVKHERGVHEGTRVHQGTPLKHFHLFYVENKHAIEDLESQSAFASEYHNLLVRYLVSQTHVPRDPFGLVTHRGCYLLP